MSDAIEILNKYLEEWHKNYRSASYSPINLLQKICDLVEEQTEIFYKSDPDPFDERHPIRISSTGGFGLVLKAILKDDDFMSSLVSNYMNHRNYASNNGNELITNACRLFLDILPGMETSFVLSESEGLLTNLYEWAEFGNDPLSSFAIGIIGVAMEIPELAGESKEKNAHLVPIMLKRLKVLCNQEDKSPSDERAFSEIFDKNQQDKKRKVVSIYQDSKRISKKFKSTDESLFLDNNSNSNWAEMQPHIIGSYRLIPLTSQMKQRLILKYLTALGGYQEHVPAIFEYDALKLLFHYIDMATVPPPSQQCNNASPNPSSLNHYGVNVDACLTFKALHYLASLFVHKKFALAFINAGGLQKLLEIRRPSMAATGVSLCLYYLAYYEEAMERICQLSYPILEKMIEYVLWLLECSHQSSRTHAVLFFSVSFSFRIILDIFDTQDGVRKMYNNLNTLEIFSEEENNDTYLSEDDLFVKRQFCRYCVTALKRYFEAQLLLIPVRGCLITYDSSHVRSQFHHHHHHQQSNAPSNLRHDGHLNGRHGISQAGNLTNGYQSDDVAKSTLSSSYNPDEIGSGDKATMVQYISHHYVYKPIKMTEEALAIAMKTISEMYPNLNDWSCMKDFYNLGGIYLLLKVVLIVGEWIFNSRNEIIKNVLEILKYATFNQTYVQLSLCRTQTFPSTIAMLDEQNSISGMCIVLMCAESNIVNDPEVQKSALGIIINCLYTGGSLHNTSCGGGGGTNNNNISINNGKNIPLDQNDSIINGNNIPLKGSKDKTTTFPALDHETNDLGNNLSLLDSYHHKTPQSHKKRSAKTADEIFHKIWKSIRNNNGLMVLLNLLTIRSPINDADEIRLLACKALCGLLKSDTVLQIMSKLPLFNNGQFQQLMREPISQDNLAIHLQFCQYANQMLQTVKGQSAASHSLLLSSIAAPLFSGASSNSANNSFDQLYRANVVAQTKISFSRKELLLLIYNYLNEQGFRNASASLFTEARDILFSSKDTYNEAIYTYGGNAPSLKMSSTSSGAFPYPFQTDSFNTTTPKPSTIIATPTANTTTSKKKSGSKRRSHHHVSSFPSLVSVTKPNLMIPAVPQQQFSNNNNNNTSTVMIPRISVNYIIRNLPCKFGALRNVFSHNGNNNNKSNDQIPSSFQFQPQINDGDSDFFNNNNNDADQQNDHLLSPVSKKLLGNNSSKKKSMASNRSSPAAANTSSSQLNNNKKKTKSNETRNECNALATTTPTTTTTDNFTPKNNEKLRVKLLRTLSESTTAGRANLTPGGIGTGISDYPPHNNEVVDLQIRNNEGNIIVEDDGKYSLWHRTNNLFYQQSPALRKLHNMQKLKNIPVKLENIITDYLREQHSRCHNPMAICPPFSLLLPHQCPVPKNRKCASFNITRRHNHIPIVPLYGGLDGKLMNKKFVYGRMKGIKMIRDPEEDILMTCCSFQKNNLTTLYLGTESGEIKCFNIDTGTEEITYTLNYTNPSTTDQMDNNEDDSDVGPVGHMEIWPDYYNANHIPFHPTNVFGYRDSSLPPPQSLQTGNSGRKRSTTSSSSGIDQIVLTYHEHHWRHTSYLWLLNDKTFVQPKHAFKNLEYPSFNKSGHVPYRIVGTEIEKAYVYDVETGMKLSTFYEASISNAYLKNRAFFSPTDDTILSDGILWDVDTGHWIHKFDKLNPKISGVFHPNGYEVIINTEIWDLRTYKLLNTVPALDQCRLTFNPTNEIIYGLRYFDIDEERLNQDDLLTDRFLTSMKVLDANTDYHGSSSNNRHLANVDLRKIIYDMSPESSDRYLAVIESDSIFRNSNIGNNAGSGTVGNTNLTSNTHHLHNANPNNVFTTLLNEDMDDRRVCRIYEIGRSKESCSREVEEEETEAEPEMDTDGSTEEDDYAEFSITDVSYHSGSDSSSSYTTISTGEDEDHTSDLAALDTEAINRNAVTTAGVSGGTHSNSLSPTSTARRRRVRRRPRSNMTTTTSASSTLYNLAEVPSSSTLNSNSTSNVNLLPPTVSSHPNGKLISDENQLITDSSVTNLNENTNSRSINTPLQAQSGIPITTTATDNQRITRSARNNSVTNSTTTSITTTNTNQRATSPTTRRHHRNVSHPTVSTVRSQNETRNLRAGPISTRSLNRIINAAISSNNNNTANTRNSQHRDNTNQNNPGSSTTIRRRRTRGEGNPSAIIIATTTDLLHPNNHSARTTRNETRNTASSNTEISNRRRSNRLGPPSASRTRHYSNRRVRRRSETVYNNEYEIIEEGNESNTD